jgi:catechol 2,3-dioxygenase-like lactoylglutathione lyase family enzyme
MDWKLELIVLPVSDVDRAKHFYRDQASFTLDHDNAHGDHFRVVQFTPPGSACSIAFGTGLAEGTPGAIGGLQISVPDIWAAEKELASRGVQTSGVQYFDPHSGPRAALPGDDLDFMGFVFFSDPDGNNWAIQQISPGKRPGLD